MGAASRFDWPFFDEAHRALAQRAQRWARENIPDGPEPHDVDAECRRLVRLLGDAGWLKHCVGADADGWSEAGAPRRTLDVRTLCLLREIFAERSGLLDFAFAMQGLGSGSIGLCGSEALRREYLPRVGSGSAISAFALSEPDAGSDVGAIAMTAARDGDGYVLDGCKTWISNGGIADFYITFARTGEAPGSCGISAFVIDAETPGLSVEAKIEVIAPHPLATLRFRSCRVPAAKMLGSPGEGFKIAMRTLDIFRPSVAAAAVGFARRAIAEAARRADERLMFGQRLADFQLTQAAIGDMAAALDASALLAYRAAWLQDAGDGARHSKEAAMAKMFATESAQAIIDRAVQIFGGLGVVSGNIAERLYREIRALRIYEGATEVQQLIVGRAVLAEAAEARGR
jgi:acyl-CoA dehydrogenase